ncbi:unnamed protein product [Anisakis simplex]|uniref:Nucleoporin_C domain-containing protein n=1 Tax=Anisakis simplex TaxID=6269 RepID=A0A0M3JUD2_ANISI|nr:unnamed protein product [Anisakis simplex]
MRPRLPTGVDIQWIGANESGSHVALIGSKSAFIVEIPNDIWAVNVRLWNERIQSTYYCRCTTIGSGMQVGSHRTTILKARWYIKEADEKGESVCDRIALLYSDSVIRVFDASEPTEVPIARLDFRPILSSSSSLDLSTISSRDQSQYNGLGLYNSIVSFDFGPSLKYNNWNSDDNDDKTSGASRRVATIFAVDNEHGALYVAPFHFESPSSSQPLGPFHIEPEAQQRYLSDVCDIIHVRHTSSAEIPLFALVTSSGVILHIVPIPSSSTFDNSEIIKYEMLAVDAFSLLSNHSSFNDEFLLLNDPVKLGYYLVYGRGSVFRINVTSSVSNIFNMLTRNRCDENVTESGFVEHIFWIVGDDARETSSKQRSAVTAKRIRCVCSTSVMGIDGVKGVNGESSDDDDADCCYSELNSDFKRTSTVTSLKANRILFLTLVGDTSPQLLTRCVVLNGSLKESDMIRTTDAVLNALLQNISTVTDVCTLVSSRLNDAHQRKIDLQEQWDEVDARLLNVIRSVLSQRVPMLTNAEKETLEKLNKMQSTLNEHLQYISQLADETASLRRERLGFTRPFQASSNARAFMLSKKYVSIVNYYKEVHSPLPTSASGLVFVSTIDGYLRAIDPFSGVDQWQIKEDPVLQSPITIQHGFTFLPDPQDGSLYMLRDGQLKKLPFSIPQLVSASPCRSNDGVLYAGSKKDVWFGLNALTGAKEEELSQSSVRRQCPASSDKTIFIGRSEYHLSMFDAENHMRRWNATFTDYSSHLLPADISYPYQHFASAPDGRLITVDGSTGAILWERNFGSTIVAIYLLQTDGLHNLRYTVLGKETMEELIRVSS